MQLTEEARDNARCLRTAERHFHAVAAGPVSGIAGALAPLLAALRLVWAVSTYYSDDARMAGLMQRLAAQVAERAEASIPLQVGALHQDKFYRHAALNRACACVWPLPCHAMLSVQLSTGASLSLHVSGRSAQRTWGP
jgi:dynein heavy chain